MTVVFLTAVVAEMSRELPRSARVFLFQSVRSLSLIGALALVMAFVTQRLTPFPVFGCVRGRCCCRVSRCNVSGLLALLDEECLVPRGSDDGYARKLYSTAAIKTHPRFTATPKHQVRCVAGVGTP